MDIDLLSKMVKEVVMDHDAVTLPSLGSFVTEIVPATFTDRGYTILPPYRRLFFSPKQGTDTLLVDIYRKSNPEASEADATRILVDFLQEMKEVLKVRKTIVFPGLGRLRATKENNFFFVADEDLDIYPDGFGLKPISLKTHQETPEETEAAVAELAQMLEPEKEPVPAQDASEDASFVTEKKADVPQDASSDAPEPAPEVVTDIEPVAEPEEMPDQVGHDEIPVEPEPEPEPEAADVSTGASAFDSAEVDTSDASEETELATKKSKWLLITLIVILSIIILAVLALAVIGRVNPQWLDQFLYSTEELEILYPGKL